MRAIGLISFAAGATLAGCQTAAPEVAAPPPPSWAETCAESVEATGERGAAIAATLCECIDNGVEEQGGSRDEMDKVIADRAYFQQLDQVNRAIVMGCMQALR